MYQVLDNTFSNILEAPRQRQQRRVRAETQRRQEKDRVTAGPEFPAQHAVRRLGDEELAMALVAAVHGDKEDGGAKRGEESTDGIKLFGEDLEDDEREGEEAQGGAHVSAFKGTLGGADFNEFFACQHHGPSSMEPEVHALLWMRPEHDVRADGQKDRDACTEKRVLVASSSCDLGGRRQIYLMN